MDADPLSSQMLSRSLVFALTFMLAAFCLSQGEASAAPTSRYTPSAIAASTMSVRESVSARLINHKGATSLNERGQGSGSFACPLAIQINISYTRATITFNCPASNGDLAGQGETAFYASGPMAHFNGILRVTHGSGRYAHATASDLHITGTLRRGSYALQASVTGSLKL